jgi:hypothetical protein
MLSVEELDGLKVGEEVEADGLFTPLTKEPLVLRVKGRTANSVDFVVTYFGVTLGKWHATRDLGGVKWRF